MTTITKQENPYEQLLQSKKTTSKPELPVMSKPETMRYQRPDGSAAINNNLKEIIKTQTPQLPKKQELSEETVEGLKKFSEDAAKEELSKQLEENDDYVYDDYNNRFRNILLNRKRRKAIEDRCSDMSITDLIVNGFVEQTVPIAPDKLSVTFRSISGKEDLLVKSLMAKEVIAANQISSSYMMGKLSMLNLCCSVVRINGRPEMDIKGADGKPDEKLLLQKFERISSLPLDFIADLNANYAWFCERVKLLSVADNIIDF